VSDSNRDGKIPISTAIVAEGGGQRGIFTAGILDAFLQREFNPFSFAIGASSGAQNLLSYWLGEQGYARRMIEDLTTKPGFYVPYRWLLAKNVVDLDQYFTQAEVDPKYSLPLEAFDPLVHEKPIIFVATDKHSGETVYLEPTSSTVLKYLKASSAVPFLYQKAVSVNGCELYDGGVADPIPVARAHAMGAEKIIVIRTTTGKNAESGWSQRLEFALKKQTLNLHLTRILRQHERGYQRAIEFIQNHPPDVSVLELYPPETLQSRTFGSSSVALVNDYTLGFQVGMDSVAKIEAWLNLGRQHC
jgi:predicted patatin/cPLA2 family phospholipase